MTEADASSDLEWVAAETLKTPLHAQMGLRVLELGPHARLTMELSDGVQGVGEGTVHGGILATFADVACAHAVWERTNVARRCR